MKVDQTIEEYQHQELKKQQTKNVIVILSLLILLPICLYFYYELQINRERSIYGTGQVISVSDISTRGKSMHICNVQLQTGEKIDAVCNSDAYWVGNKEVTIEKIQTVGDLFMYQIKDTSIHDLTHHSSGTPNGAP